LVTAFVGLAAGFLLEEYVTRHAAMIIVMVPPLNAMGGNVGGVLGARLSSALHLGVITPDFRGQSSLGTNILASGILGGISFFAVGLAFFAIEYLASGSLMIGLKMMTIYFFAGLLLVLILIGVTVVSAFISYRRGIDPDNVVMPIVTTAGDLGGISCLLIMVHLVGL